MPMLRHEPTVHFCALGLLVFLLYSALADLGDQHTEIRLGDRAEMQMRAAFQRVWQRPPSDEEYEQLVLDWVREEVANREAEKLGMHTADPVIRRRMRQKYEAHIDQLNLREPSEAELTAWLSEHADQYAAPARFGFEQILFSADTRDNPKQDAINALNALSSEDRLGLALEDRTTLSSRFGDLSALPSRTDNARLSSIANRFGQEFADALADLPVTLWSGPIPSAFGFHLVRVVAKEPAAQAVLDDVRSLVERDHQEAALKSARDKQYDRLLQQYELVRED
ncbi:MAG: peptidyl-prolyl cis-trans isomerase [Pseudomonadota bacterium]